MPRISVLLPVLNASKHLREAIDSILNQTYTDFELIIINEFGSNDGSHDIVYTAREQDTRIVAIQNKIKMGLAESLNYGMRTAKGEYIARMDADDLSDPTRFEKQTAFLDNNPNISLCGTWQKYFGTLNHVHAAAILPNDLFANFLFECDICHSTVMFKKADFLENNLFYDSTKYAEDYDLWVRATHGRGLLFANIPEILGFYRHSGKNITRTKMQQLHKESAEITRELLKELSIFLPSEDVILLGGWLNPFSGNRVLLAREKILLDTILENNKKYQIYEEDSLLKALGRRWLWANQISYAAVGNFDYTMLRNKGFWDLLLEQKNFMKIRLIQSKMKQKIKRGLRRIM